MKRTRWQASGAEMVGSMLARGDAARERYIRQIDDATLTPRRRRLAACHLRVMQRQLELIGLRSTDQAPDGATAMGISW